MTVPIQAGQRFRHYKGGEYTVLALAHHSETGEKLVIYQAEYDTDDLGSRPVFARPRSMFLEKLKINGQLEERFELL